MEDFMYHTRQTYKMNQCKMNGIDCRFDWKVIGTLNGQCLVLNQGNKSYPRDAELRFSVRVNHTGKNIFLGQDLLYSN